MTTTRSRPTHSEAAVLVGPREFEFRSIPIPDPLPHDHALLKVEATGICGSDYHLFKEHSGPPLIGGHEVVGTLIEVPPGSTWSGFAMGDRVGLEPIVRCGHCPECVGGRMNYCRRRFAYTFEPVDSGAGLWGGFSQYMVLIPGTSMVRIPSEIPVEDAVLFNPIGNGFEWVCRIGGLGVGDAILIMGGGQRGLASALAAKEAGAATIIVTGLERDREKLELARTLGATHTIIVDETDVPSAVSEITAGDGVDVVLDLVPGSTQPMSDALQCVRSGGTIVVAGIKSGPTQLDTNQIVGRGLRILGATSTTPSSIANAARIIESRKYPLEEFHTHCLPLAEIDRAIRLVGAEFDEPVLHVTVVPPS
jgi:threonine dehydrogenase-like Zn-dependent dehydrogenase